MSVATDVYGLLGLARRAGAVVPGTAAVREAIRAGEARLVLFAGDASASQLDKVRRTLKSRPVRTVTLGDRTRLGSAVGMAPLSALALTSEGLASQVYARLGGESDSIAEHIGGATARGAGAGEG
jgi:ribosomal protein L7Ae-like RNA K-turn-binding protein